MTAKTCSVQLAHVAANSLRQFVFGPFLLKKMGFGTTDFMAGCLSWDHTTFTCDETKIAHTKAQYSTSNPLLANLPLAPNGVVQSGQNLKVRVWVNVLFAIV